MDAILELLVPSIRPAPELDDPSYELDIGGETHRVQARRMRWGRHLELVVDSTVAPEIKRRLVGAFAEREWTVLGVEGRGLDVFAGEARGRAADWEGPDLLALLRTQLLPDADWVVAFTRDDEEYVECGEGDLGDVERRLAESCASERPPRGFIVVHHGSVG
jgi:hypothetical protein